MQSIFIFFCVLNIVMAVVMQDSNYLIFSAIYHAAACIIIEVKKGQNHE